MARKKLEIKANSEQLELLYSSLKAGAPLQLALSRAGITRASYYYWVAIASIVVAVKSQEEIEELEEIAQSGVSIQNIRDMAAADSKVSKDGVANYVEPSAEAILKYRKNKRFREFADRCYEIISQCDSLRSEFATAQLVRIALSTQKKNGINPSGAMWWLERNMPDHFAKPSDKAKDQENEGSSVATPPIQVEFIDPGDTDTQQRLLDMEKKILNEINGKGDA